MKKVVLQGKEYELIKNEKNAYVQEETAALLTDYFDAFDYVLGDYSYDKLRLKGFNEKGNPNFRPINDIAKVNEYIENYCSYGARYFLLKKVK